MVSRSPRPRLYSADLRTSCSWLYDVRGSTKRFPNRHVKNELQDVYKCVYIGSSERSSSSEVMSWRSKSLPLTRPPKIIGRSVCEKSSIQFYVFLAIAGFMECQNFQSRDRNYVLKQVCRYSLRLPVKHPTCPHHENSHLSIRNLWRLIPS